MDYKVTDTELTNLANAIRQRGNTSESLAWCNGYINAISAIPQPSGDTSISQNGTYDVSTFANAIVNVPSSSDNNNVTVSENEPTAQQGTEGDIWVQYEYVYPRETVTREYTLNITRAWRGAQTLSYAGATELDVIFDDGHSNEVSIRDLTGFTYSASGGTIKNAFDNSTSTYWEHSSTPIWCKMSATVPAGYAVKYLKVMQRSDSYTTDVWRDFNFIETANNKDITLIEREELTQADWAGAGNYTLFKSDIQNGIVVKNTFIKVGTAWMSPAQIDVSLMSLLYSENAPKVSEGINGDIYLQHFGASVTSDGDQFIQTTTDASTVYGMEFVFIPKSKVENYQTYISGRLDDFTVGATTVLSEIYIRVRGSQKVNGKTISLTTPNVISCRNGIVKVNGEQVGTYSGALGSNSELIHIFSAPNEERKSAMEFYELKLYDDNDVLVHDIKPSTYPSYGVCLYDEIDMIYFVNGGSGSFVYSDSGEISNAYCKVNNIWQNLIGTNIDDVNTGEGAQLTTRVINENGIYRAKDEGYYGYSEVTVNNIEAITGINPTDENEYYIKTDNNYLVETLLPSRIEIVTPPTKTVYADDEVIDTTGMVVKAYNGDGDPWEGSGYTEGVIPLDEITIESTIGESSGECITKGTYSGVPVRFLEVPVNDEIQIGDSGDSFISFIENTGSRPTARIAILDSKGSNYYFYATAESYPNLWISTRTREGGGSGNEMGHGGKYTINGIDVWGGTHSIPVRVNWENNLDVIPINSSGGVQYEREYIYWEMWNDVAAEKKLVTVGWNRIKDSKLLTANFEITVE